MVKNAHRTGLAKLVDKKISTFDIDLTLVSADECQVQVKTKLFVRLQ